MRGIIAPMRSVPYLPHWPSRLPALCRTGRLLITWAHSSGKLPAFFDQRTDAVYSFDARRSMKEAVDDFERQYIAHVLRTNQYNKEVTAKALKISLSSLYRKIEELEIPSQG